MTPDNAHYGDSMTTIRRRYAMTKLAPGDWLLPSNDTRTIWRINRYDDPEFVGQKHGWQVHRVHSHDFARLIDSHADDPLDWSHWEYWGGGYRSRAEAVDEVLNAR